ncbi:MAG: OmpA family protein [Rhodospirillales bacterium]|nr:OmpA family protein [Rhodospirillales bacterium]
MLKQTSWIKKFGVLFAAAALAGCAGMELDKAKSVSPTGSAFQSGLYKGYVTIASWEQDEFDYADADAFAMRAVTAAGGTDVQPEAVENRKLPMNKVGELTSARQRLINALTAGGRGNAPADAAHAQVMFDCWIQEQEENFQPPDIAKCRAGFMTAIARVEAATGPKPMAKAKPMVKSRKFIVYFPFNSSKITPAAKQTLMEAIDAAKGMGAKRVNISGHTDLSGAGAYNAILSSKRSKAVAGALETGGVSYGAINVSAFGESAPSVKTPDNVQNAKNRRVEINISN